MDRKPQLTLVAQAEGYFHELLTSSLGKQRVKTKPETEFYLVNLLSRFISTDSLYQRDENGNHREEPLALMIKQALETLEPRAQSAMFRHIGDVSLYVAGYFQDSLSRKLVDVDYYIDVGGSAYKHAANRVAEDHQRSVFAELASKFSSFVEVLADVSEKTVNRSEQDLLRLYDTWLKTRSERAAKALQEAGILPTDPIKQ
jgi:hypothetical protein